MIELCLGITSLKLLSNTVIEHNAGEYSQIKIGKDNLPFMIYQSRNYRGPAIAHCQDIYCQNITHRHIDNTSDGDNSRFNFMLMSPSTSYPQFSYSDQRGNTLSAFKFITCFDILCYSYHIQYLYNSTMINNLNDTPGYSAFTYFDINNGIPIIAYEINQIGLNYVVCKNPQCSMHENPINIIKSDYNDNNITLHYYVSIAYFETFDFVIFTYYNHDKYNLEYKICDNLYCNGTIWRGIVDENLTASNQNYGKYQFMRKITDDSLSIIYVNETSGNLKYAYCNIDSKPQKTELICLITVIDYIGTNVFAVFPELDEYQHFNAYPVMSYFDSISNTSGSINFAECNNIKCDNASIQTLSTGLSGYGRDSSIAYLDSGSQSMIYVSFLNYNGGGQKISQLLVLQPVDALLT